MLVGVDRLFAVAFACLGVSQDELAEALKNLMDGGRMAYG